MSRGRATVERLGKIGNVAYETASQFGFIYETSTVKSTKYEIGDRVELDDGREYRYCLSTTALITVMGCHFVSPGIISYTAAVIPAAIGDSLVVVPAATHSALVVDELKGGYMIIFKAGVQQFRGIIGNVASAANAAVTVYLDGALDATVTTSSAYEVYGNPYRYIEQSNSITHGRIGPPAVAVAASGQFVWVQVKGPIFLNPQATVINNEGVGVNFRHDGSIEAVATALGATVPDTATTQYAGYRMSGSASGNGPLVMLTG